MGFTLLSRSAAIGLTFLVVVLWVSCRTVIQPPSGGTIIEPRSDLQPGSACDLQFGAAKVNAVFSAINRQDIAATLELFPTQGEFVIEPMFELAPSIRQSIKAGQLVAASQVDTATNRAEVAPLVSSLAGLHFVFTAPLQGNAGLVEHVSPEQTVKVHEVDLGPVLWKATGPTLERYGKRAISGSGKIASSGWGWGPANSNSLELSRVLNRVGCFYSSQTRCNICDRRTAPFRAGLGGSLVPSPECWAGAPAGEMLVTGPPGNGDATLVARAPRQLDQLHEEPAGMVHVAARGVGHSPIPIPTPV